MSAEAGYRILDEPTPGRWTHLAVDPLWPLLASMFGGTWLSWSWFVVNGHVIGSPTRWRETALAVLGFAGAAALALLLGWTIGQGWLAPRQGWWGGLAVTLWKMGVSYWLFVLQRRTFDLYAYFGGRSRNGVLVLAAGLFLRGEVLGLLPNALWMVVLG